MIHVVAILTAKPGQRDAMLAAFADYIPIVHTEPGCVEYATASMRRIWEASRPSWAMTVSPCWKSGRMRLPWPRMPPRRHGRACGRTKDMVLSRVIHMLTVT